MLPFILQSNIASLFSIRFLIKISRKKIIFPFYHTVNNYELPYIKHVYPVRTIKKFKNDLEYLLKYFEPVHPNEIAKITKEKKSSKNYMLLSFDDGLKGNYEHVMPVLKELGIPAIFFVNSAFIDNKGLFYRYKESLIVEKLLKHSLTNNQTNKILKILEINKLETKNFKHSILKINFKQRSILNDIAEIIDLDFNKFLQEENPYLTSVQIKEMLKNGYAVGSHSVNHPPYYQLNFDNQIRQTEESIRFIKEKFNIKEHYFSFPFTDYKITTAFFNKIYKELSVPVKYSFGSAGLKNELFQNHFQRIPIEKGTYSAKQIIKSEYIYYLIKSIFGKNIIRRK